MSVDLAGWAPPRPVAGPAPADRLKLALRPANPDQRLRGLAELLVQAHASGDLELVDAVDAAVRRLPADASGRFTGRLRKVRALFGPVPGGYPAPGHRAPAARRSSPRTRGAVAELAEWADIALAAERPVAPALTCDADAAALIISQYRPVRPAGHRHVCRDLAVPRELTWRTWWWTEGGPMLGVPRWVLPRDRAEVMFGLHAGAHLDHQSLLAAERGPNAAIRLEFGSGLLVAEAIAMAVEYAAGATRPGVRHAVRQGLLERLARLPGLSEWGPAAAPTSNIMAEAATLADAEFCTLPRLAAAYTAGPVLLARRRFSHPLVPAALRGPLLDAWTAAWR